VAGGSLLAEEPYTRSAQNTFSSSHPPLASVARVQAEAALTRDDIPPSLRRFVRNYFMRLQSTEKR
jgi:hypothetical protein